MEVIYEAIVVFMQISYDSFVVFYDAWWLLQLIKDSTK